MRIAKLGDRVAFRLAEHDVAVITGQLEYGQEIRHRNPLTAGQEVVGVVVKTFGGNAANLQLFLDGDCQTWVTSRLPGELPGTFRFLDAA